jgi:IS30 family transposase
MHGCGETPISCTINESNYLSVPRIASDLGRQRVSIYRFIKRRRIQPAFTLNGFHYYTRATLGKIAKGMRRKNGYKKNGDGQ